MDYIELEESLDFSLKIIYHVLLELALEPELLSKKPCNRAWLEITKKIKTLSILRRLTLEGCAFALLHHGPTGPYICTYQSHD